MKTCLYLGLHCPSDKEDKRYIHCPLIQIVPKSPRHPSVLDAFAKLENFTHLLFTSQTTVSLFFNALDFLNMTVPDATFLSVGKKTTEALHSHGVSCVITAEKETAEGLIDLISTLPLESPYFFWPHSAKSRPALANGLNKMKIPFEEVIFYDTLPLKPDRKINFEEFDEIFFTSPSTVDAFKRFFVSFPKTVKLSAIGPITLSTLTR